MAPSNERRESTFCKVHPFSGPGVGGVESFVAAHSHSSTNRILVIRLLK